MTVTDGSTAQRVRDKNEVRRDDDSWLLDLAFPARDRGASLTPAIEVT